MVVAVAGWTKMSGVDAATAYVRLALVAGIGPILAHRLLAAAGDDVGAIFRWRMDQVASVDGVGGRLARRLLDPALEARVEAERAACRRGGITITTLADDAYPKALRELPDPPLALWMRGEYLPRDRLAVTVVGPRRPSAYGHRQARRLTVGLARVGATIVSGLARGVDTVAHEAALAGGARTMAVIGSGFEHLYPPENVPLADRIGDGNGAVISEFPCDVRPSPGTFPRRNRLLAALGIATLVVEAGERSGALITARLAGELGRTVFALPGPIDRPEHIGSNRLLRDGAVLATGLDDIIEEIEALRIVAAAGSTPPIDEEHPRLVHLSGRERNIYQLLCDEPRSVDDIVRLTELPPSQISATLMSLELRRLARKAPAGYCRAT